MGDVAMTIKPQVEDCGCIVISETEMSVCPEHWAEYQRDIAWMHDDRDLDLERGLWKLLVEDV